MVSRQPLKMSDNQATTPEMIADASDISFDGKHGAVTYKQMVLFHKFFWDFELRRTMSDFFYETLQKKTVSVACL